MLLEYPAYGDDGEIRPQWFDKPEAERLAWLLARGMTLEKAGRMDKAMRAAFFRGSLHAYCKETSLRSSGYDDALLQAAYEAGVGDFAPTPAFQFTRAMLLLAIISAALLLTFRFGMD